MKKHSLALLLVTTTIFAEEVKSSHHHGSHHNGDIVVVSLMDVFEALHEVADMMKAARERIMQLADSISKMAQRAAEREKAFSLKAKNMTSEAREKERIELERENHEIRIRERGLEEKQQEEQMMLQQKISEKIKEFCKSKGWKIVIPGALYADPSCDKTQEVIDGMNKEYDAKMKKEVAQKKASNKDDKNN